VVVVVASAVVAGALVSNRGKVVFGTIVVAGTLVSNLGKVVFGTVVEIVVSGAIVSRSDTVVFGTVVDESDVVIPFVVSSIVYGTPFVVVLSDANDLVVDTVSLPEFVLVLYEFLFNELFSVILKLYILLLSGLLNIVVVGFDVLVIPVSPVLVIVGSVVLGCVVLDCSVVFGCVVLDCSVVFGCVVLDCSVVLGCVVLDCSVVLGN
jgi:hypothetical protein